MRRMFLLLLAIICLLVFAGGVIWKINSANQCAKQKGTVVGAMTRNQRCIGVR
ncbi:MAG: hypothetical protein QHC40_10435 [Sphingobium sp.]|nr:hypothetical protein [Sphingobium sp.]